MGSEVTDVDVGPAREAVASGETLTTASTGVLCSSGDRHPPTDANPTSKRNPNTILLNIAILLVRL
jgi:hypothetical protein